MFYEAKESVAKITLNQPEERNAPSRQTLTDTIEALDRSRNDGEIRVVEGRMEKLFRSGGYKR